MRYDSLNRQKLNEKELPDSIYKSVVSSLYADSNSLAIGIMCCIAGALVLFFKTLDPAQVIFAAVFFFIGTVRLVLAKSFHDAIEMNIPVEKYKDWEHKYSLISSSYILILCLWYTNGLIRSDDPYVQLLSLSLILCYLIGIIGRNFASKKVIRSQVTITIIMLIGTSLLFDDFYGVTLTLFLLPFLFAIQIMSARLRGMLFRAEINALNNRTIANRFDVALDNVTHGIAMIDKEGIVVVANDRFMGLAGMGDWEIIGCNISILNTVQIKDAEYSTLGTQIEHCLKEGSSSHFTFSLNTGAVIEAEYNFMGDGGVIVLSDVSERKASEKEIRNLADYDPLTGLSNRRHFMEQVETSLVTNNSNTKSSMYFIDLDKFKAINDTLGHGVGDDLLRIVASRLKLLLKPGSLLCRFGGDEFVIFCPDLGDVQESSAFAEQILRELQLPVVIKHNQIDVGGSIGISLAPEHGNTANMLLQYADAALYESKANGRSTYTFYTTKIGQSISDKRQLETDLRQAISNDEIELHYQPLFNVKNCSINCCEALARWNHPRLGYVSPLTFIGLAEETGLIVELGEKLLRKAMLECKTWSDEVRVAVNVSSIQFQKSDVFLTIRKLLQETGLPAHKLHIEITESAMINNVEDITVTLNQISNLGVQISLDDFGTGFSSLSYLDTLPFDTIKIDRSFVENAMASNRSLVLLQGVVDMVKRLDLKVVLEGIETQEQLEVMERSITVHDYQGFLFFKPMNSKDVFDLLSKHSKLSRERIVELAYLR